MTKSGDQHGRLDLNMDTLKELLEKLASDDAFRTELRDDPRKALAAYGIDLPAGDIPDDVMLPPKEHFQAMVAALEQPGFDVRAFLALAGLPSIFAPGPGGPPAPAAFGIFNSIFGIFSPGLFAQAAPPSAASSGIFIGGGGGFGAVGWAPAAIFTGGGGWAPAAIFIGGGGVGRSGIFIGGGGGGFAAGTAGEAQAAPGDAGAETPGSAPGQPTAAANGIFIGIFSPGGGFAGGDPGVSDPGTPSEDPAASESDSEEEKKSSTKADKKKSAKKKSAKKKSAKKKKDGGTPGADGE